METDKNIVVNTDSEFTIKNANHIWPLDVAIALRASRDLSRDQGAERRVHIRSRSGSIKSVEVVGIPVSTPK